MTPSLHFLLCTACSRSVPSSTQERYCPNDGQELLTCCPRCDSPLLTPFPRFCTGCGLEFATLAFPQGGPLASPHSPSTEAL